MIVRCPPSAEQTELILANRGANPVDISLLVYGNIHMTETIRAVLRDPERYDPVVDEVAVRRALDGDLEVWQNLTHHERRQVLLLVKARWEDDRAEERWARELFGKSQNRGCPREELSPWFGALAQDWCISRSRLLDLIHHVAD